MQEYTVKTDTGRVSVREHLTLHLLRLLVWVQEEQEVATKGYSLGGFVLIYRLGHNHFLLCMSLIVHQIVMI